MLYALLLSAVTFLLGWIVANRDNREQKAALIEQQDLLNDKAKKQQAHVQKLLSDIKRKRLQTQFLVQARERKFTELMAKANDFRTALDQGFLEGRKWLAQAWVDLVSHQDDQALHPLSLNTRDPADRDDLIAELRTQRYELLSNHRMMEYQLASYEEYFPFLADFRDTVLNEDVRLKTLGFEALQDIEPALAIGYLSETEYRSRPIAEVMQIALKRYLNKSMSRFEYARHYERFIRYLFEKDGWQVTLQSHIEGFNEFGRDLFCVQGDQACLVVTEYHSESQAVREHNMLRLYRSMIQMKLTRPELTISLYQFSHEAPTDDTRLMAEELDIHLKHQPLRRFPMVKCQKDPITQQDLYHLPFDPGYDELQMTIEHDSCYQPGPIKAEQAGYVRSGHWLQPSQKQAI